MPVGTHSPIRVQMPVPHCLRHLDGMKGYEAQWRYPEEVRLLTVEGQVSGRYVAFTITRGYLMTWGDPLFRESRKRGRDLPPHTASGPAKAIYAAAEMGLSIARENFEADDEGHSPPDDVRAFANLLFKGIGIEEDPQFDLDHKGDVVVSGRINAETAAKFAKYGK